MAFVAARRALIFGVDEESDAPDILSDAEAAVGRAEQESAAKAAALKSLVDGQAAKPKDRGVVTGESFLASAGDRCDAPAIMPSPNPRF